MIIRQKGGIAGRKESFFRRSTSELGGVFTFVEKMNTKLKQTLKTGNRCKIKTKQKPTMAS